MKPAGVPGPSGRLLWGGLFSILVVGGVGWFGPGGNLAQVGGEAQGRGSPMSGKDLGPGSALGGRLGDGAATDTGNVATDARLDAFLQAYGSLIDSVIYQEDDVVLNVAGTPIHYQDGRMLGEHRLDEVGEFDPIFYRYPLGPLVTPPPMTDLPTYSTDYLEALFGRTEAEVRGNCQSLSFLDHNLFVNTLILEPLGGVEREVRKAAAQDPEVARWLKELDVAYSFIFRDIAKSRTRSLHGFGLAVDLVPRSYGGRQVYWQWSRAQDREGWQRIPLSRRWSPPQAVIDAFEHNGFVWGGKWPRFDTVHFEYRPEILLYNQAQAGY